VIAKSVAKTVPRSAVRGGVFILKVYVMVPFLALLGLLLFADAAAAAEEPPYGVVLNEGSFEIRDYPTVALAEVTELGDRNPAAYRGFRTLAGYIFGGNARKQRIEMMAPVIEQRAGVGTPASSPTVSSSGSRGWIIRFVMPHGLSLGTLPEPDDQTITLVEAPPSRVAVIRFSGLAGDDAVAANTAKLEAYLKTKGFVPIGPPTIAQYDPPWTLWFMRRNEVMIPIGR
jgi:SOUL heme-binding protein